MIGISRRALEQSYRWSDKITEKFPESADLVDRLLVMHRRRYRMLAGLHAGWFKSVGAVEVVLSVAFPLVFLIPATANSQILPSAISISIAIAAALRAFYSWDSNWRLYRSQEVLLGSMIAQWEVALLEILLEDTSDEPTPDARRRALEVTRELMTKVTEAFDHEHTTMFDLVVPPENLKNNGPPPAPS